MENENFNLKAFITELLDNNRNEEDGEVISSFFRSDFSSTQNKYDEDYVIEFRNKLTASKVVGKHVDSYGGEGCGDDYWSVYSFESGDDIVYVKFEGSYHSYTGAEFDCWYFVEPRNKIIMVFEKV